MHAAQLALNVSLGYVAFSFLCGVLWIAAIEFWGARPPATYRPAVAQLPKTKTPPEGGACIVVNAVAAAGEAQMLRAARRTRRTDDKCVISSRSGTVGVCANNDRASSWFGG
jgi:hypothetical protein